MMPGVGFEEMILLVIVAIVVIGPKDLPLMMRKFGRFTGKMRALAFEFRQGIDELGRQAELEELRKEVSDLKKATGIDEIRRDLAADKAAFDSDVASAMNDPPKPAEAAKEPAPYAGFRLTIPAMTPERISASMAAARNRMIPRRVARLSIPPPAKSRPALCTSFPMTRFARHIRRWHPCL